MKKKLKKCILLPFIIIVLIMIGIAFARYVASVNGEANAKIAKYSFIVNGKTNENFNIDLADTRTGVSQEIDVEEGYIGPGTAGAFTLNLDASRK